MAEHDRRRASARAVIATDPSGSVLLLNKVAEQLTGWPLADARGKPIWEVFPRHRREDPQAARRSRAARFTRTRHHPA